MTMRHLGLVLALVAVAPVVSARKNGIAGQSGQGAATCNDCHSGGAAPKVKLSGPEMLEAGATGTYRLVISGGAAVVGGLGVSVDDPDATLSARAETTRVVGATQLVHNAPLPFSEGKLSFEFDVTAPPRAAMLTLYAAGNSCDGDGTKLGDQAATTTLAVEVTGPSSPSAEMPTATMPAPMRGGCSLAPAPTPVHGLTWLLVGCFVLLFRSRAKSRWCPPPDVEGGRGARATPSLPSAIPSESGGTDRGTECQARLVLP
jgi:hypothetical protein